jgi:uncharacterized protein YjbJ (UPF0337 family)
MFSVSMISHHPQRYFQSRETRMSPCVDPQASIPTRDISPDSAEHYPGPIAFRDIGAQITEPIAAWYVDLPTGHHPPPLVQGRFLGVVGDAAGYAHIFLPARFPAAPACLRGTGPGPRRCTRTRHNGETKMNWDRIEGNWKQFKGKAQQQWGKLTNDDLDMVEGKRTELAGRLQQRYGYAKDQAEREIDTWLKSVN